jgi:hypothetical protein
MLRIDSHLKYERPKGRGKNFKQIVGVNLKKCMQDYRDAEMDLCVKEQLLGELLTYGRSSVVNHLSNGFSIEITYRENR